MNVEPRSQHTQIQTDLSKQAGAALTFGQQLTKEHYTVQQTFLPKRISIPIFLGLSLFITGCQATADIPFNPLNFTVPIFLIFYSGLSAIVFLGAAYLRDWILYNPEAEQKLEELELYEIAYYAGGEKRVIATAITSLFQQGTIHVDNYLKQLSLKTPRKEGRHPLEREVAKEIEENGYIYNVTDAKLPLVQELGDRISQQIPSLSQQRHIAALCGYTLPVITLLGLGAAKISVELSRHNPITYLLYIFIIIFLYAASTLAAQTMEQREHRHALRKLRQKHGYDQLSQLTDQDPKLILAFALLGRKSLPGGEISTLGCIFRPISSYGEETSIL